MSSKYCISITGADEELYHRVKVVTTVNRVTVASLVNEAFSDLIKKYENKPVEKAGKVKEGVINE